LSALSVIFYSLDYFSLVNCASAALTSTDDTTRALLADVDSIDFFFS
jgi:hypothetical protein